MSNEFYRYTLAGLFALAGIGAGHSTVRASDVDPRSEDGSSAAELDAEPACSNPGDTDELGRATTSAMSSPYYCICCEATGNGSCCSKC